jgi:hypothetical protein
MRSRSHLGIAFEIWQGDQSWFWLVVEPERNRGAIGVSPTEAEAVRDACASIEERSPATGWNCSLTELERYLVCMGHRSGCVRT